MWNFSKIAVALLVVIIIIFVITTLGFVVQTFNIASSNMATIIGGVMGMIGGFAGAMGAYLVAKNQMAFEKIENEKRSKPILLVKNKEYQSLRINRKEPEDSQGFSLIGNHQKYSSLCIELWNLGSTPAIDIKVEFELENRENTLKNLENVPPENDWFLQVENTLKNEDLYQVLIDRRYSGMLEGERNFTKVANIQANERNIPSTYFLNTQESMQIYLPKGFILLNTYFVPNQSPIKYKMNIKYKDVHYKDCEQSFILRMSWEGVKVDEVSENHRIIKNVKIFVES